MTNVNAAYISALETRDIKRYANEIAKIPNRGSVAGIDSDRGLTFSETAAGVEAEVSTAPITGPAPAQAKPERSFALWEKGEFGLGDFVDIINPLQHIPIVATIYRNMTGDKIGFAPRIIGGALWGKIGGFVSGIANAVTDWFTGKDIGDHIFGALFGKPTEDGVAVAQAVKPGKETSASEPATAQIDSEPPAQTASWLNPFAFEDRFAELTGHLSAPIVAEPARPDTVVAAAKFSALSSYGRNTAMDDSTVKPKLRAVA